MSLDPAGIQTLLDQIRSSQAWQELAAASKPSQPSQSTPTPITTNIAGSGTSGPSVASLLSQLRPAYQAPESSTDSGVNAVEKRAQQPSFSRADTSTVQFETTTDPIKDLRSLDFEESMPILLQLSRNPPLVEEVKKIKRDQDVLERQLWEERRSVHRKYEEKLKAAKTKAGIIGSSISKHDAEMLVDAHRKEISKFDRDRALPAWDSLVSQQQLKLQRLQVPTMHITSDSAQRGLQQRVLQVLTSIIGLSAK